MSNNAIISDSYKYTHASQYPVGTTSMQSYVSPRADNSGLGIDEVIFFGPQRFVKEVLMNPIDKHDVDEAEEITQANGIPFERAAFDRIVDIHGGFYPVRIRAIKEGSQVKIGNALLTAESTDPQIPWVESFLETSLLSASWYGTSVATISNHCRKIVFKYLRETSDNPLDNIPYSVLDFGMRAAHSETSAAIAGAAHLISFKGTDTISALPFLKKYYNADLANLGHSAVASEHSTTTSWGRRGELGFWRHMIKTFGGVAPVISLVADSYDVDHAVSHIFGVELKKEIENCGSLVVIRLDSGDSVKGAIAALGYLEQTFGVTLNSRGFKVLKHVKILQADGVNPKSIEAILVAAKILGFSAENIAFGMGGQLHTAVNRDTFSFAMKCSAIEIDGIWADVYKDPISGGKTSKRGRLALIDTDEGITTVREDALMGRENLLEVVYEDGTLVRDQNFNDVRRLAAI
jgi:nicotinamide phosphoribosyltransferase